MIRLRGAKQYLASRNPPLSSTIGRPPLATWTNGGNRMQTRAGTVGLQPGAVAHRVSSQDPSESRTVLRRAILRIGTSSGRPVEVSSGSNLSTAAEVTNKGSPRTDAPVCSTHEPHRRGSELRSDSIQRWLHRPGGLGRHLDPEEIRRVVVANHPPLIVADRCRIDELSVHFARLIRVIRGK